MAAVVAYKSSWRMLTENVGGGMDWSVVRATEAAALVQLRHAATALSLTEFSPDDILPVHDDSVFFTSAAICRFKRGLLNDVHSPGGFVEQWCFRDRNFRGLQDGQTPKWGSCFRQFGTVGPIASLAKQASSYCHAMLSLANQHGAKVKLKASSSDVDLLETFSVASIQIEVDGEDKTYFRHRYGHERLVGRNANFAISPAGSSASIDVGNIIAIERDGAPFAVEIAIGIETLNSALNGAHSSIVAAPIADPMTMALTGGSLPAVDVLSVVLHLHVTGIRPFSSNQGRIFRRYLDLLSTMTLARGLDLERLVWHCAPTICTLRRTAFDEKYWSPLLAYLHERTNLPDILDAPARNARMSASWSSRWPSQESSE